MKLKGINPAEQHIEKIVLGSLGVVLLGVLTLQFAFPPPGVTVANQEVKPDKAYEPVQAEAIRTLAAMNNTEPQLPDVSSQALATAYQNALNAKTVPTERMAALGPAQSFGALELESSGVGGQYAMPTLPQPTTPVAATYRGTVHPSEWAASEALREVLGADQPFDLGVVTVQAFIDGQAVRTALLTDPDGDAGPARSLPPSWWSQGFEILGVQLERERLASDGSWTEATVVGGLPGRPDLLAQIQRPEAQDPVVVIDLARLAGSQAEQITKPDFYRTIAGERWQPPAARQQSGDPNREQVQRIVRQLRGVERDLQLLEDAMSNQTQETRTPPAGDPGGGGRGGRGGGGGREVRQPAQNEDRADPRVARMERLETQIDVYVQELETLGYEADGTKIDTGELSEDVFGKFERMFDNNKLAVWAHDLTAQGGETYRYRLRPVFNNPVYGRGQALSEEQQSLAADRTFPGPWSAWGEPVEALARDYYFVVNAREGNRLGGGPQASVELYRFYYGYYRRGTQAVEPGDMLLAQARVPEGLRLYDLSNMELLEDLAPEAAPAGRGTEPEGGGRPGRGVADPRDIQGRERGAPAAPERGQPAQEQMSEDLPGEPALAELPVIMDVVLLDIARLPGSGGQQEGALVEASNEYRAFLTPSNGGTILVRNPAQEQESPLYQAVEASWRAGQRASEPEETEAEQPGLRRQPRDDAPRAPRAPAGGGGGGGGGAG